MLTTTLLQPKLPPNNNPFHHHQHHLQNPTKNKTLTKPHKINPTMSWPCSKCTFLNSPSQKHTCQICNTPISSSSSNSPSEITILPSPSKWACKACTFLNSYSLSSCEVCGTRYTSLSSVEIDDFDGSSSLGNVFFPLRKCGSGRVEGSGQLGIQDLGLSQMGSRQFVDQGGGFSVGPNLRDSVFDNVDSVSYSPAKKDKNGLAMKGVASGRNIGNAEDNASFKRKLCDLGDFFDKPSKVDGFCAVKSSKKSISVLESVAGSSLEKVAKSKPDSGSVSIDITENAEVKEVPGVIKILSYNVWFAEDVELHVRMQAISDLIELHSPDVICFQEVIPDIYVIFQNSTWWRKYHCSISNVQEIYQGYFCMQLAKLPVKSFSSKQFNYSAMGRELSVAEVEVNKNKSLVVATSHLESPCPGPPNWDQMYSKERVNQAKEAVKFLQQYPNVIFCGDMNWDDSRDGQFPLAEGWFDAWEKLRPSEIGYTYDTKTNKMLTGNRSLRKRLDRFICYLTDFEIRTIEMIGTDEIPGATHKKTRKLKGKITELTCPVLPSDHYGLLLTISSS